MNAVDDAVPPLPGAAVEIARVVRAFPTLLRIGVAEVVAYRAEFLVWILTTNMSPHFTASLQIDVAYMRESSSKLPGPFPPQPAASAAMKASPSANRPR